MNDINKNTVTISIDMKKFRLRVHKAMLHLLGDPPFIQLLVNPVDRLVAIRAVDRGTRDNAIHKVNMSQLQSDFSIEIYSREFVTKLCELAGINDISPLYHMTGEVLIAQKVAVFSVTTLCPTKK